MEPMGNWAFGITLTIVGMGGTFVTLWLLSVIMNILKKMYPFKTLKHPGKAD